MEDISPTRQGRSWVLRPKGAGWVFEKSFPTKWKAQLALDTWRRGGRVSDYWVAARRAAADRRVREEPRGASVPPVTTEPSVGGVPNRVKIDSIDEDGWLQAIWGLLIFFAILLAIVAVPLLGVGLSAFLVVKVPVAGKPLLALFGGAVALAIAGAGRRGWHSSATGSWYCNYWGSPPLSGWRGILVFLIGAVVALSLAP
jgi:hypothetical protein